MRENQKVAIQLEVDAFIEESLANFDNSRLQFFNEEEIAYVFEIMEEKFRREMRKLKSDYAIVNTKSLEDSGG